MVSPVPAAVSLDDQPDTVRTALSPIRRRLLERLREPGSATQVAAELRLPRQRVNYHLRALEDAGLLDLVEERQRRGCVERILAARARAFVVDPNVLGAPAPAAVAAEAQDRFSAEHLIHAAGDVVRHVSRMRARAEEQRARLLTFAIDTELAFASPADFEQFTTALAAFVVREAASRGNAAGGRKYRVLAAGYPAPGKSSGATHARSRTRRSAHRRAG
jgi:DNA-binding transcriptional ArsR family regulator